MKSQVLHTVWCNISAVRLQGEFLGVRGLILILCSGIVDSSGLRFYYTKNVRQHDAAIFMTGTISSSALLIPPKQKDWKMKGYCPAVCTEKVTISAHNHNNKRAMENITNKRAAQTKKSEYFT